MLDNNEKLIVSGYAFPVAVCLSVATVQPSFLVGAIWIAALAGVSVWTYRRFYGFLHYRAPEVSWQVFRRSPIKFAPVEVPPLAIEPVAQYPQHGRNHHD